jgi:hypothetical protein
MPSSYSFKSKVVVYPGMAAWRFLGLPKKEAGEIKERYGKSAKGWGSLPVTASIGRTSWDTSIFPDKKSGTYVLPLKSQIRKAEGIADTDTVAVSLRIR